MRTFRVFRENGCMSSFRTMRPEMVSPAGTPPQIRRADAFHLNRPITQKAVAATALDVVPAPPGADDQIVIGIQEVAPSQAMEMAEIMPDVAGD